MSPLLEQRNYQIVKYFGKCSFPGGGKRASPTAVLGKPNGDLRMCGNCKIGVNQKICLNSYPIPNIENILLLLAGLKCFTKIDLKCSCHQIQTDDKFKEITTINSPIGMLRCLMGCKQQVPSLKVIENILRGDIKRW